MFHQFMKFEHDMRLKVEKTVSQLYKIHIKAYDIYQYWNSHIKLISLFSSKQDRDCDLLTIFTSSFICVYCSVYVIVTFIQIWSLIWLKYKSFAWSNHRLKSCWWMFSWLHAVNFQVIKYVFAIFNTSLFIRDVSTLVCWWIILYVLLAVFVFWVFNTAVSNSAAEEINTKEKLNIEEKLDEEEVR